MHRNVSRWFVSWFFYIKAKRRKKHYVSSNLAATNLADMCILSVLYIQIYSKTQLHDYTKIRPSKFRSLQHSQR